MTEPVSFTSHDLLDSLMRAAMADGGGPLSSLAGLVSREMGTIGPFRDAVVTEVSKRIPQIADAVASKVPETIFTRRYPTFGRDDPEYQISSWLKEPLTAALAEALRPAMVAYVEENFPTMELDSITVNVTVKPR